MSHLHWHGGVGAAPLRAPRLTSFGAFSSRTMMVMITAITPSLNAASRSFSIAQVPHSVTRLAREPTSSLVPHRSPLLLLQRGRTLVEALPESGRCIVTLP